jgi:sulfur-oxidizing protein SoxY
MRERGRRHSTRRDILAIGAGLSAGTLLSVRAIRPATAAPADMEAAIRAFAGEARLRPGRVKLDLPPLVENGNAVPLTVSVDSPMTATDHVKTIAVFNEKNPQPNVAVFHLGPRSGKASVSTRVRLADTQKVIAIAELSDGSMWSDTVEVVVTLAACVEGL